jgi:hypothetical protein
MPDPSIGPVLHVSATATVAGAFARVLMALHVGEQRWLALMIEAIKELSAGVDAFGSETGSGLRRRGEHG